MEFDYNAPAEFFAGRSLRAKRAALAYRRFDQAADAILYAMERLDPALLRASFLEIDETRYGGAEIERLYASERFPLERGDRAREAKARQ